LERAWDPKSRVIVEPKSLHGGPARVRRSLPELIDLIWNRKINPGKVFDLTLPLDQVAEGYRAMDQRRSIKTLLLPEPV
jgi:threonine dehydrogenase-like Zn-dependent dehydrogenase